MTIFSACISSIYSLITKRGEVRNLPYYVLQNSTVDCLFPYTFHASDHLLPDINCTTKWCTDSTISRSQFVQRLPIGVLLVLKSSDFRRLAQQTRRAIVSSFLIVGPTLCHHTRYCDLASVLYRYSLEMCDRLEQRTKPLLTMPLY